jgi:hypothetical protein
MFRTIRHYRENVVDVNVVALARATAGTTPAHPTEVCPHELPEQRAILVRFYELHDDRIDSLETQV